MTTLQSPIPAATQSTPQPRAIVDYTTPPPPWPRKSYGPSSVSLREQIVAYTLLIGGSILFLIPFYFVINASLKTEAEVQAGRFVKPPTSVEEVKFGNYARSLKPDKMNFWPALSNTVVITTLSVLGQVLSCSLVGFGFARFRFRGRGLLFMVMLSTMMLPAQVTMIPVFILFRALGMIDTFWPLVLPMWLASP